MILEEIAKILEASFIANPEITNFEIKNACSADMMSAVLYYHTPDSLLLTSLTQPHVIRTAEIAGIKSIVFVLDKKPDTQTIELAQAKKIPLLSTPYCMYTASGRLFNAGLPGCLEGK